MDRKNIALKCIDLKKGKGLELGPLYSPIVLKNEANIFYVDHMSTEDLRSKYQGHPFAVEEIVPVDYVVGGTNLKDLLKDEKFNYIIASHVIEHLPDVVGWLHDLSAVLKPGGIVSLVIPDKRYSFDVTRDVSTPAQIIGGHLDNLKKATSAMIYESAAEYREISPSKAWVNTGRKFPEPSEWNLSEAIRRSKLNLIPDEYIDSHCYVFTPYSFFYVLKRLILHDMFDFEVVFFSDTKQNELEFYVSLKKIKGRKDKKRQLASIPRIKRPLKTNELEFKVQQLEQQLSSMMASRSWRITRPLRSFSKILKG